MEPNGSVTHINICVRRVHAIRMMTWLQAEKHIAGLWSIWSFTEVGDPQRILLYRWEITIRNSWSTKRIHRYFILDQTNIGWSEVAVFTEVTVLIGETNTTSFNTSATVNTERFTPKELEIAHHKLESQHRIPENPTPITADYVIPDTWLGFLCKHRSKAARNIPENLQQPLIMGYSFVEITENSTYSCLR